MPYLVLSTQHEEQLEYAANHYSESEYPICFRSDQRWARVAQLWAETEGDETQDPIKVVFRNTEDPAGYVVAYSADLFDVWLQEDFKSTAERRRFVNDWLWMQREVYQGATDNRDFSRQEVEPAMEAKTLIRVNNFRRIDKVSISRFQKRDGSQLSATYRYGNVILQSPPNDLLRDLNTHVELDDQVIDAEALNALDQKFQGTPEEVERVIHPIQRPSALRNAILRRDGTVCRICGNQGFRKRNGERYAEVHHMYELCNRAPGTLQSWNLIVVCPTCHKKLHFADVEVEYLEPGWRVRINDREYQWR